MVEGWETARCALKVGLEIRVRGTSSAEEITAEDGQDRRKFSEEEPNKAEKEKEDPDAQEFQAAVLATRDCYLCLLHQNMEEVRMQTKVAKSRRRMEVTASLFGDRKLYRKCGWMR